MQLLNELQDYINPMQVNGHVLAILMPDLLANNALQFHIENRQFKMDGAEVESCRIPS